MLTSFVILHNSSRDIIRETIKQLNNSAMKKDNYFTLAAVELLPGMEIKPPNAKVFTKVEKVARLRGYEKTQDQEETRVTFKDITRVTVNDDIILQPMEEIKIKIEEIG